MNLGILYIETMTYHTQSRIMSQPLRIFVPMIQVFHAVCVTYQMFTIGWVFIQSSPLISGNNTIRGIGIWAGKLSIITEGNNRCTWRYVTDYRKRRKWRGTRGVAL